MIESFAVWVLEAAACVVLCGTGFRVGGEWCYVREINEIHITVVSEYLC